MCRGTKQETILVMMRNKSINYQDDFDDGFRVLESHDRRYEKALKHD